MARIFINKKWYEQVEPSTFAESEFENRILLHAPSIYPEYHATKFKQTVESPTGKSAPDLAFISKDFDEWFIVEVEMGYHSFAKHVEPQVQNLADASYGDSVAEYLHKISPSLDKDTIFEMVRSQRPGVLVIVNEQKEDWARQLSKYGAIVATFELFRSANNDEIFRVNGEYPAQIRNLISRCSVHPMIPRFLEVHNPNELKLPARGRVILRYNNCITEWERLDAEGKVWLDPIGRNPLGNQGNYEIFRQKDAALVLRKINV